MSYQKVQFSYQKEKLERALNNYQQAKRDEAERVKKAQQEEQRRREELEQERRMLSEQRLRTLWGVGLIVLVLVLLVLSWLYLRPFVVLVGVAGLVYIFGDKEKAKELFTIVLMGVGVCLFVGLLFGLGGTVLMSVLKLIVEL